MTSSNRHIMYSRLVTGILYGKALEQAFMGIQWNLQGFLLFGAVLLTTVRYFLASIIFHERITPEQRPLSEFADFWMNLLMSGLAVMLGKHQGDVRMIYFALGMVFLDLVWCAKNGLANSELHQGSQLYHALRGRIAIDISVTGILVLTAFSVPFPLMNGAAMPLPGWTLSTLTVTLIGAGLADFVLNSRLYHLE